jgi:oligopeptide transport system substrate-binding protein
VTSGPYVLEEWIHDVRRSILRNPLFPADMAGVGNIERWITDVVPDPSTGYALWLNNEVDRAAIPNAELEAHLEQFPDETIQEPDLGVFYFGFNMLKPPFDNVDVRRAFSAAFDRETYLRDVRQGQGLVMTHFAPPGMFGAPPINEVGISFDPDAARAYLAEGGYPDCEGLPPISLVSYTGQGTLDWVEFGMAGFAEHLGCDSSLFSIEQLPFRELLLAYSEDVPLADAPAMWTAGWGPDYPDENNWVGDVLWCENRPNDHRRECSEVDDLIVEARVETDPDRRIELYAQIEEMFFGEEGIIPFTPHYVRIAFLAQHDWYDRDLDLFGGVQMYNNSIDQDAKLAAQDE